MTGLFCVRKKAWKRYGAEREPYYAEADIRIDTTGKNVEDVVREILQILERGV